MQPEQKEIAKQRVIKYVNHHGMPRESRVYQIICGVRHLGKSEFSGLIHELVTEGRIARIEGQNQGNCHFLLPTQKEDTND